VLHVPGTHAAGTAVASAAPAAPAPVPASPAAAPAGVAEALAKPREHQVASLPDPQTMTDAVPEAPGAAGAPSAGAEGFRWPVRGRIIAGFGKQPDGARNDGINLAVPAGTPIKAAEQGTVIYAGNELQGYGNLVLVQHKDGWVSAYAHADELTVRRGDGIQRGQVIGKAGTTGSVSQPQLHFELRKGSKPVDPLPHLSGG
jgi:murein DD-endopeptidase MepM/ murein hydrolase activator NlpD